MDVLDREHGAIPLLFAGDCLSGRADIKLTVVRNANQLHPAFQAGIGDAFQDLAALSEQRQVPWESASMTDAFYFLPKN
jgi:hypothetical protein